MRNWDFTDKDTQQKCVEEVITRIQEIEGDPGIIAAQDIIDIVKQNIGPQIYNNGVRDAKRVILDQLADMETDIDLLEQNT